MTDLKNPHGTATRQDLVVLYEAIAALILSSTPNKSYMIIPPHVKEGIKEILISRLNS